jgi:hypothetical protein
MLKAGAEYEKNMEICEDSKKKTNHFGTLLFIPAKYCLVEV